MAYKFLSGSVETAASISGSSTLQIVGATILGNTSNKISASAGTIAEGSFLGLNSSGVVVKAAGGTASTLSGTTAQLTTGVETAGYLKVTGSVTLAGKISSSAGAEIVGNSVIVGTLNVTGAQTLAGKISSSAGAEIVGNSVIVGTLNVTGAQSLAGKISSSAGAEFVGATVFIGASKMSQSLDVVGALDVDGAVTLNGAVTLGDGGEDAITSNGMHTFEAGQLWNVTASGGSIQLTEGALMVLANTSGSASTVELPELSNVGSGNQSPANGTIIVIKNAHSNSAAVTVTCSSETAAWKEYLIDGAQTATLESPYGALNLYLDLNYGGWHVF